VRLQQIFTAYYEILCATGKSHKLCNALFYKNIPISLFIRLDMDELSLLHVESLEI